VGGGESKLGPLGTSATEWPIVPTPGDYDDGEIGGMKIGRGNLPQRHFVHHKSHLTRPGELRLSEILNYHEPQVVVTDKACNHQCHTIPPVVQNLAAVQMVRHLCFIINVHFSAIITVTAICD
jgi:hypothetical protein